MREQYARDRTIRIGREPRRERIRSDRRAERRFQHFDVKSVRSGDRRQPLSEHADRTREHFVARRKRIRDAVSKAPVPDEPSTSTSPDVPKTGFMPASMRAISAANSGPR